MPSPKPFPEVAGHAEARDFLARALREGRLPHALLLSGPEGIGKFRLARAVAKAKLCLRGGGEACGACASCRPFEAGGHPDYLEVEPKGATIPIAAIRGGEEEGSEGSRQRVLGLTEWIERRALGERGKCAVVRDADRMNAFAQNALLKTLEEPPGDSLLFLTAVAGEALLETVVSRCLVLRLRALPLETVEAALVASGRAAAPEAAAAALLSGGSLGEALELLEGEAGRLRALAARAFEGSREDLRAEVFSSLGAKPAAADRRVLAKAFLKCAAHLARERWRASVAEGDPATYLRGGESERRLEALLEAAGRSLRDLERNVEPGLLLDLLAAELARACKPSRPSATG